MGEDIAQLLQVCDLVLRSFLLGLGKSILEQVCRIPAQFCGLRAVLVRVVDEVAILHALNSSFSHGLLVHRRLRLANKWHSRVVAVRQSRELIVDSQKLNYPLSMSNVGVCEKPYCGFASVNVLEQLAQLGVGLDDVLEGQSVINLGVVVEGVDLVVTNESFDGQTVVSVVLLVKSYGFLVGKAQMFREVLVDEIGHDLKDPGACDRVSTRTLPKYS